MVTNKGIPTGLFAATQLTRAGRLLEATALIQHILRHGSAPAEGADRQASNHDCGASNDIIDVEYFEVAEPTDRGPTPLQRAANDSISKRFGLKSFPREWRGRDSAIGCRVLRRQRLTGNRAGS